MANPIFVSHSSLLIIDFKFFNYTLTNLLTGTYSMLENNDKATLSAFLSLPFSAIIVVAVLPLPYYYQRRSHLLQLLPTLLSPFFLLLLTLLLLFFSSTINVTVASLPPPPQPKPGVSKMCHNNQPLNSASFDC